MYSVVLMAALTTGTEAPDFFFRNGCRGCNGCWGASCHGCYGGCYGGCHGCRGYQGCWGCHGSWAVSHGCWGSGCWGCHGYWSGWYAAYSCHGCYGGWSCHGCLGVGPVYAAPAGVSPGIRFEQAPLPKKNPEEVRVNDRSRIVVELPEDARLYIDGNLMRSASARRVFRTPELNPDLTYFYDVKAEVVRNGRAVSETQRVIVRPGQEARANFTNLDRRDTATAQAR
jgi:uncharacterized protein (TIGR03000 family)